MMNKKSYIFCSIICIIMTMIMLVGCVPADDIAVTTPSHTTSVDSTVGQTADHTGDLDYYASMAGTNLNDQILEVTGVYTDSFWGVYYIGDISGDFYVAVSFEKKTAEVKALNAGDIITVKGRCIDSASDKYQLSAVVLVSVTPGDPDYDKPKDEDVVYAGDIEYFKALGDIDCEDEIVELTGVYTDKFLTNYYLGDKSDFYFIVSFDEKTDQIKNLSYGDIVTTRGRCINSNGGYIQIVDAILINVQPGTAIEETSKGTEPAPTEPPVVTPPETSSFSIHFIDVGQADAALIECDGHYMLIDGGNKADSNVIYSVLRKAGVTKLDIVVGTHAHEDHIGGLPGAYKYCSADLTLSPVRSYNSNAFTDFAKYADQKGNGITIPSVGDTYSLGSATIKILGVNGGSDTNDTSIVLRIDYGETSFLFAGDAERAAEQAILSSGADLSSTVLKVGHHGSDTSTTYPFLREIMPQYAVISVGDDNSYGHPTEDTLSRLRDAGVTTYRTDMQGDIYCTSDGKSVTFTVEKNENADTLGAAAAAEDKLEKIVKNSCKNYNAKKNRVLDGTLTYTVISSTKVELNYNVSEKIYTDTEYLVDDVLDELLAFVIADINAADLPDVVNVSATANYEIMSGESDSGANEETQDEGNQGETHYILNTNSKKFHYPGCHSANRISDENRKDYYGTREELIDMGYDPCGNCDP